MHLTWEKKVIFHLTLMLTILLLIGVQNAVADELFITHGVASGDVTANSAVVWARASGPADMHVEYDTDPGFGRPKWVTPVEATQETDLTAQARLHGLKPHTRYFYRVWFTGPEGLSEPQVGSFKTAPAPGVSRPVSFVFGGDLGGQRYCRRVGMGYAIFTAMEALTPDFFVANGDMIYGDGDCPKDGPDGPGGWQNIPGDFPSIAGPAIDWTDSETVREIYWRHWRYNRADPHLQSFFRSVPMYAQWDDHEVINDFGALWDDWNVANIDRPGFPNLVAAGRDALFHYSPIRRDRHEPHRIYRSFDWSRDLDLFIVDARSYRSRNDLADTPENNKTMLGRKQLEWLKRNLAHSRATWKVVSVDVPLSIPTGSNAAVFGRDGWANGTAPDFSSQTGFERELRDLLEFLDRKNVKNLVFVVTDVHFAANLKYKLDADGDGDLLVFHELVTGPLSAVQNPAPTQDLFDPTFNPLLLYGDGPLFNFGYVRIAEQEDGIVHLLADVRDEGGNPRPGSEVDLIPQP